MMIHAYCMQYVSTITELIISLPKHHWTSSINVPSIFTHWLPLASILKMTD